MSKFWRAALIRAFRTFCQVAAAAIGTTQLFFEVNWVAVLSTALLSSILSLLTSCATGLPEAKDEDEKQGEEVGEDVHD